MLQRRRFLIAGTTAALSTGLALWFRARSKESERKRQAPDPRLQRDPHGILDLAPGFSYHVLERALSPMDDGYRVPARPDAMGCFDLKNGTWALMRNHELDAGASEWGPYNTGQKAPPQAYDPASVGGVTRVLINHHGQRMRSNLVLTGTARNCAGGVSPWGWLTCEETVEPGHGYVFACSPRADSVRAPQRISAYGRFQHEAVAIDPNTMCAYLTEDRKDGCLYRFVPETPSAPHGKGQLQALAVTNGERFDLGQGHAPNAKFDVRWIPVPHEAGEREDGLRFEAHARGAAIVKRGEGIVYTGDGVVFTCTEGGPIDAGQVFHLAPTPTGGTLTLLAQSLDQEALDMPDNITVMPSGDLVVCEDNHRITHLRVLTKSGRIVTLARNVRSESEFAGVCFSPDGRILFVNIQEDGLTLAIQGPWEKLPNS
jgi:secreted PhoX family phosphatase